MIFLIKKVMLISNNKSTVYACKGPRANSKNFTANFSNLLLNNTQVLTRAFLKILIKFGFQPALKVELF